MCCFQEHCELPSTPTHYLPMTRMPKKTCSQGQVVNNPPEHKTRWISPHREGSRHGKPMPPEVCTGTHSSS